MVEITRKKCTSTTPHDQRQTLMGLFFTSERIFWRNRHLQGSVAMPGARGPGAKQPRLMGLGEPRLAIDPSPEVVYLVPNEWCFFKWIFQREVGGCQTHLNGLFLKTVLVIFSWNIWTKKRLGRQHINKSHLIFLSQNIFDSPSPYLFQYSAYTVTKNPCQTYWEILTEKWEIGNSRR